MSSTPPTTRPLPRHVGVAVVGSGFGGIAVVHALRKAGRRDLVVLERGDDVGGTWRDNSYPGCACDVPSRLYSLSFAPNPDWSHAFSGQAEIQAYLRRTAAEVGVHEHLHLRTTLTGARWDDVAQHWQVSTDRGDFTADAIVAATGGLSEPKMPDIPGISGFEGAMFHSARWDHELDLSDKRVTVIGTGASAIQFVPHLVRTSAAVTVVQRTAPWILPRADRRYPAWERALYRRFPVLQRLARATQYAVHESYVLGFAFSDRIMQFAEKRARAFIAHQISDPELRAKVTPNYRLGCKRVLLANDYYPALADPRCEVVTDRVVEVLPRAVVTEAPDGSRRVIETDVLVLGTGFDVSNPPVSHLVVGREGLTLAQSWGDDGMQALHGTTVAGFPNYFHIVGPNTGTAHTSLVYFIESQVPYVMAALQHLRDRGLAAVEPRREAMERDTAGLQDRLQRTVWHRGGCASWYLDDHGRNPFLWPTFSFTFRRRLATFPAADYVEHAPHPVPAALAGDAA